MASGAPVACSDDPAPRELAGNAAISFEAWDVAAMAAAIGVTYQYQPYTYPTAEA